MDKGKLEKFYEENMFAPESRERAGKILGALDGMSIFEAQEMLDACKGALMWETVDYLGDKTR